jgi:MFS family permease
LFLQHGTFDWDEQTQGLILSSFFWGYVITHLPGGMLAEKFGGKYALGLGILSTAIFTLLTPLAANYGGASWLIAVRFFEGLGEVSTFQCFLNFTYRETLTNAEEETEWSNQFQHTVIQNM